MKRVRCLLLAIFVACMCAVPVHAESISFTDVVNALKSSETYNYFTKDMGEVVFESSENELSIINNYTNPTSGTWTTKFTYDNGVISYNYSSELDPLTNAGGLMVDNLWISQLVSIVANVNGYTKDQLLSVNDEKLESYTLEDNGIEVVRKTVSKADSTTVTYPESLKLNINNLKLDVSAKPAPTTPVTPTQTSDKTTSSTKPNATSQQGDKSTSTTVVNPSTGRESIILSSIAFAGFGVIGLHVLGKRKVFRNF